MWHMPRSLRCAVEKLRLLTDGDAHVWATYSDLQIKRRTATHTVTLADPTLLLASHTHTHTASICVSLNLKHHASTQWLVVTQTSLMWFATKTHLFGFVIKTIFHLTFYNYVSAFNSTLSPTTPSSPGLKIRLLGSKPSQLRAQQ